MDHVVPVAYFDAQPVRKSSVKTKGIRTPSCGFCNGKLSSHFFNSFTERCMFVKGFHERKLRKFVDLPGWEKSELRGLCSKLRTYVRACEAKRTQAANLLDWYGSDSFYAGISDLATQPGLDKESQHFSQALFDYFESELTFCRVFHR
jgi:hypothetical protein